MKYLTLKSTLPWRSPAHVMILRWFCIIEINSNCPNGLILEAAAAVPDVCLLITHIYWHLDLKDIVLNLCKIIFNIHTTANNSLSITQIQEAVSKQSEWTCKC